MNEQSLDLNTQFQPLLKDFFQSPLTMQINLPEPKSLFFRVVVYLFLRQREKRSFWLHADLT